MIITNATITSDIFILFLQININGCQRKIYHCSTLSFCISILFNSLLNFLISLIFIFVNNVLKWCCIELVLHELIFVSSDIFATLFRECVQATWNYLEQHASSLDLCSMFFVVALLILALMRAAWRRAVIFVFFCLKRRLLLNYLLFHCI